MSHDTTTTRIQLLRPAERQGQKRSWTIRISHGDITGDLELLDPFEAQQYSEYFKYYADDSFRQQETLEVEQQQEITKLVENAKAKILGYAAQLLTDLKLDAAQFESKRRDILVIENCGVASIGGEQDGEVEDTISIHNIVWELLESPEHWTTTKPTRITVTRVICQGHIQDVSQPTVPDLLEPGPVEMTEIFRDRETVRVLLVTARDLTKKNATLTSWQYEEITRPGVIQHSITQVKKHLEDIGHHRKIELEILRPATFAALREYLDLRTKSLSGRQLFDIIHLDMHGLMKSTIPDRPEEPHLMFVNGLTEESPDELVPSAWVSVARVADTLQKKTNILVLNVCNSSSATGELGIRMVRTFLNKDMASVSATSYRLQEAAAKIYYPAFYMSLLLEGCFSTAAAEARLALRHNQIRYGNQKRDDYFVYWNWSNSTDIKPGVPSASSWYLCLRMLQETVPCWLWWLTTGLWAFLLRRTRKWGDVEALWFSNYHIHRNFSNVKSHINYARLWDVPLIDMFVYEFEIHLERNKAHSLYLHPAASNLQPALAWIGSLVRNSVRHWVEIKLFAKVRVLRVEKMLKYRSAPPVAWNFPRRCRYPELMDDADWSWPPGNVAPAVISSNLLVIEGFEHLEPRPGCDQIVRTSLLGEMVDIAKQMNKESGGNLHLLTIGGKVKQDWKTSKLAPPEFLGRRWAAATVMMVPLRVEPYRKPLSYTRRQSSANSHI